MSATPICASLAWVAVFRLGLFFNAIVGSLARMPLARPKKADDVMADASSVGHLMRDAAAFGARWIWTLAFGYRDDR